MNTGGVVLAVDFVTSNTAAALRWPGGKVRAVLFDGSPLLPSAVAADCSCVGDELRLIDDNSSEVYRRVGPPQPYPR